MMRIEIIAKKLSMKINDYDLLKKVKRSDINAFQTLFLKYQPVLFRFLYYKTQNYSLSQDIVQDTFLKVWLKRESLKPKLSFYAYIARISNNLLKDHFKREQVRNKHKDAVLTISKSVNHDTEAALDVVFLEQYINTIINESLPKKCRTIFILSRIEGKTNQEIADLLNITRKTVENQISHALKILRKKLEKYL